MHHVRVSRPLTKIAFCKQWRVRYRISFSSPRCCFFYSRIRFLVRKKIFVVAVISILFVCACMHSATSESESCEVEGTIRTQSRHNVTTRYHLLQVCLFGQWNYVCHHDLNDIILSVVLQQLGYTEGGARASVCIYI